MARKRVLSGPGEGMPYYQKVWIVQDNTQSDTRAPTHKGYARTPDGKLWRLNLWLTETPDGLQTYLEGKISQVLETKEDRERDEAKRAENLAIRRAARKTRSQRRLVNAN